METCRIEFWLDSMLGRSGNTSALAGTLASPIYTSNQERFQNSFSTGRTVVFTTEIQPLILVFVVIHSEPDLWTREVEVIPEFGFGVKIIANSRFKQKLLQLILTKKAYFHCKYPRGNRHSDETTLNFRALINSNHTSDVYLPSCENRVSLSFLVSEFSFLQKGRRRRIKFRLNDSFRPSISTCCHRARRFSMPSSEAP